MEFGERIKDQRKEHGWTQADVAKKLFVTRQAVSNWEKGKTYPDLNTLVQISDVFQISVDSLLKEDAELKNYLNQSKANLAFNIVCDFIPMLWGLFYFYQAQMMKQGLQNVDNIVAKIFTSICAAAMVYQFLLAPFFRGRSMKEYQNERTNILISIFTHFDVASVIVISLFIIFGVVCLSIFFVSDYRGTMITGSLFIFLALFDAGEEFVSYKMGLRL